MELSFRPTDLKRDRFAIKSAEAEDNAEFRWSSRNSPRCSVAPLKLRSTLDMLVGRDAPH